METWPRRLRTLDYVGLGACGWVESALKTVVWASPLLDLYGELDDGAAETSRDGCARWTIWFFVRTVGLEYSKDGEFTFKMWP